MDSDRDGWLSQAEQKRYFSALAKSLREGIELRINGKEVPLRQIGDVELSMPFRKRYRFEVPQPAGWERGAMVELHNDNYLDWNGTLSMSLDPGQAADIVSSAISSSTNVVGGVPVPCQRDATFCYRRGTGRYDTAEASAALAASAFPSETSPAGAAPSPWWMWRRPARRAAWVLMPLAAGAALVLLLRKRLASAAAGFGLAGGLAATATLLAWHLPVPGDLEASQIFQDLHRGIYRAFEARTECEITTRWPGAYAAACWKTPTAKCRRPC
jgi:hypothetical protein